MIAVGNHLWQSTLVVILAALLAWSLRNYSAKLRFRIWFLASMKFLVPFSILMTWGAHVADSPPAGRAPGVQAPVALQMAQPFGTEPATPPVPVSSAYNWIGLALASIWLSGSLGLAAKRWREWRTLRSALRSSTDSPIQAEIPVRFSSASFEPAVVGWRRPVLLVPPGIACTLTEPQLHAVLIHETCHARRKDNVLSLFHMAVELLFWFHPFVWWIGARLLAERERACDDEVLRRGIEPRVYADGILAVCRTYSRSPVTAASGVTGWSMRKRIEEIMANCGSRELSRPRAALLITFGACVVAMPVLTGMFNASLLVAQSPSPRFQSVTVSKCPDASAARMGSGYVSSGGVLRTGCMPLADEQGLGLIQRAYVRFAGGGTSWPSVVPVEGKPSWFASEAYEIAGKAHPDTPQAMMEGAMLRAALEDRFRLKVHEESVSVPVYELSVDFEGPKLRPFREASCMPLPAVMPPPKLSDGERYCTVRAGSQPPAIDAEGATLGEFSKLLSLVLDRPVIDKTGISGRFTIRLEFTPDSFTPRLLAGGDLARFATAPAAGTPTIVRALEQLGLRLQPGNGVRTQLVIDHVEKPSGN